MAVTTKPGSRSTGETPFENIRLADSHEDLQGAVHFSSHEARLASRIDRSAHFDGGARILGPVEIGHLAKIGEGTVLASGVKVGDESVVKEDVELWPGATVGVHSTINPRARIYSRARVGNRTIVAPGTEVPADTQTDPWMHVSTNPRTGKLEQHDLVV